MKLTLLAHLGGALRSQFVVQSNHQGAERKRPHKVPRYDVEAVRVRSGFLPLHPFPQTLPVAEGQRPQGFLRVLGDVRPGGREVQPGDEEALCRDSKALNDATCFSVAFSAKVFTHQ